MPSKTAIDEILNFAIKNEQESVDFYTELAAKFKDSAIRETFTDFAREEAGHKQKLERVKNENLYVPAPGKIENLKIADYLGYVETKDELNYPQALKIAMIREKRAFKLYTNLSESALDDTVRELFAFLAQEEAKHKLRFEIEYDENVLTEN